MLSLLVDCAGRLGWWTVRLLSTGIIAAPDVGAASRMDVFAWKGLTRHSDSDITESDYE
jgi:hypothetical protein